MNDRLDDAIRLIEELQKHYAKKYTKLIHDKQYDEAKRVHLMSRGVDHSMAALKKLRSGRLEII